MQQFIRLLIVFVFFGIKPVLAEIPIVPKGITFTCTPVAVWDGDGPVWCEEGPRIRLSGIAAREIDNVCKKHHPCPRTSGLDARDALVNLLGTPIGISRHGHILIKGAAMRCTSDGGAKGNRTAAWCVSNDVDVNCTMVTNGWAFKWPKYWREHVCK
ncbi:MAG: hypothetical protein ABJN24_06550 [Hyphomicrobiales bacterium]